MTWIASSILLARTLQTHLNLSFHPSISFSPVSWLIIESGTVSLSKQYGASSSLVACVNSNGKNYYVVHLILPWMCMNYFSLFEKVFSKSLNRLRFVFDWLSSHFCVCIRYLLHSMRDIHQLNLFVIYTQFHFT